MPFIVRWPGHTPADIVDEKVSFAPSICSELMRFGGAALPGGAVFDGLDRSAVLLGKPATSPRTIFWNMAATRTALLIPKRGPQPDVAMREGDWKFLVYHDGTEGQLYDLKSDPKESMSVVEQHPEIAARMQQQVLAWRKSLPEIDPGPFPSNAAEGQGLGQKEKAKEVNSAAAVTAPG